MLPQRKTKEPTMKWRGEDFGCSEMSGVKRDAIAALKLNLGTDWCKEYIENYDLESIVSEELNMWRIDRDTAVRRIVRAHIRRRLQNITPPPHCSDALYEDGIVAGTFEEANGCAWEFERWVRLVAKRSKQEVGWHYEGDSAVVKTLGDLGEVQRSIEIFRDMLPKGKIALPIDDY
jgi:hypothetical protein